MGLKRDSEVTRHELELIITQLDHELHETGQIANIDELRNVAERLRKEHEEDIKFSTSTILK